MDKFSVRGPFEVSTDAKRNSRVITPKNGREFFADREGLAQDTGCYVFAVRAGRGAKPLYVGAATKGFGQEALSQTKRELYNRALADIGKGTPLLFFVVSPKRIGKGNSETIHSIEQFLIQTAVAKNKDLLNSHHTGGPKWGITGVFRGGSGKASGAADKFSKMMSI